MQLVPPMLGDVKTAVPVEVETFRIAQPAGIALLGREALACNVPARVSSSVRPTRMRHAVLDLAAIGGRAYRHEEIAVGIDDEWVHRMIAVERHALDNGFGAWLVGTVSPGLRG
jgi:hypothetical protein